MIKRFHEFINENVVDNAPIDPNDPDSKLSDDNKLYIYHRKFKLYKLKESKIYSKRLIEGWKKEYGVDDNAHCLFVTVKDKPVTKNVLDVVKHEYDIKNINFFNPKAKDYRGWRPLNSKLDSSFKSDLKSDEVYLYIFKKNSNQDRRARQIHGFIYESEVRRGNTLQRISKTHKWDAQGGLDKRYLLARLGHETDTKLRVCKNKEIDLFSNGGYKSLVIGTDDIDWSNRELDKFKSYLNWSIKCMKTGTDIEMGDFKRISGLELNNGKLTLMPSREDYFMLSVGLHDGSNNILEEYIIYMSVKNWKSYLPDINANLSEFENMYNELKNHKLVGSRTTESELAWDNYMEKYKKLSDTSLVKLRFKRDSKGQLRIQSSISFRNFKKILSENPHIRIR